MPFRPRVFFRRLQVIVACLVFGFAAPAGRAIGFALRVVVVGLAMGVAPPSRVEKILRHVDPVVQVEEEKQP